MSMISFIFDSFYLFLDSGLLFPMVAIIFVFASFRLAWYLLLGGWSNE